MKSLVHRNPASFVKPAANASLVTIGASSSTPTSDHVPDDTKAVLCRSALGRPEIAATAEAVSCDATSTNGH